MHTYATDSDERVRTILVLAVVAALVAAGLDAALHAASLVPPWYVGVPTPLAVFGVLYAVFERWAWRWRLGPLRVSPLPDLRGTWVGEVRTVRNGDALQIRVRCLIRQTWQRVGIELESSTSRSVSTMAAIETRTLARPSLTYTYVNEPRVQAAPTMHMHQGTARLRLAINGSKFEGDYYSGRDRGAHGTLELQRVTRKLEEDGEKIRPVVEVMEGGNGVG